MQPRRYQRKVYRSHVQLKLQNAHDTIASKRKSVINAECFLLKSLVKLHPLEMTNDCMAIGTWMSNILQIIDAKWNQATPKPKSNNAEASSNKPDQQPIRKRHWCNNIGTTMGASCADRVRTVGWHNLHNCRLLHDNSGCTHSVLRWWVARLLSLRGHRLAIHWCSTGWWIGTWWWIGLTRSCSGIRRRLIHSCFVTFALPL